MSCVHLGEQTAWLVESSRSGEGKSALHECRCEAVLVELTHPRHRRTGLVAVERDGVRTSGHIACCEGCPYRVEKEKPKPRRLTAAESKAKAKADWEVYIASTAHLPGTILHNILEPKGYGASPTCSCRSMIRKMNAWGPDGCLEHIEEIAAAMVAEAKKRKLMVPEVVMSWQARRWIRQAVREAKAVEALGTP